VVDRTDAASRESRPETVPVVNLLEADQFPANTPGLIDENPVGDGDARSVLFGTFVGLRIDVRHGL
jgi:hypothetical protein